MCVYENTRIYLCAKCLFINTHTFSWAFLSCKVVVLETDVINGISPGAEHGGSQGSLYKC